MNIRVYTKAELDALRTMPKRVINPRARWSEKPKAKPAHRQRNFQAVGQQKETDRFEIYQRQNLTDDKDFSCGIRYLPRGAPPVTLARYNGPSHTHGDIMYRPHIHRATEEVMSASKKPESEAKETERYTTIKGALACLIDDFALREIDAQHDEPDLFP